MNQQDSQDAYDYYMSEESENNSQQDMEYEAIEYQRRTEEVDFCEQQQDMEKENDR